MGERAQKKHQPIITAARPMAAGNAKLVMAGIMALAAPELVDVAELPLLLVEGVALALMTSRFMYASLTSKVIFFVAWTVSDPN